MGAWGLQTLLDDADFVRDLAAAAHPGKKPAVGGVSLGSIAGIALLDAHPHDYAGAFLLEGTLYQDDPGDRALAGAFCQQFDALLGMGVYYDGQGLPGLKLLATLATVDPHGPSPVPGVPAGFSNHQVLVATMNDPGIGPLTPRPGYSFMVGDPVEDVFFFADDTMARDNLLAFSDYTSIRMMRDIDCGLSGERTFTSNLGAFRGPVFVNGGGHGFGPAMLDTLALMTRAEITVNFEPEYGHMDQYFAVNHRELTEDPIEAWLREEVFVER
jgi:pimeloyl-ACP methyl ester carboxylesterase